MIVAIGLVVVGIIVVAIVSASMNAKAAEREALGDSATGQTLDDKILVKLYRQARAARCFNNDQINAAVPLWREWLEQTTYLDKMNALAQMVAAEQAQRQANINSTMAAMTAFETARMANDVAQIRYNQQQGMM
jgi:hypothetical protein